MDWKLPSNTNLNSSFLLFNAADILKKKAHLARAEAMLINADTSALTHQQKISRKNTIEELHRYRVRGEFAMNEEVPGYSSVFKDRQGTLCAVAHLVYSSGHEDLVEKVSAEDNFLTLSETKTDVLNPWLEQSGITYEEAAIIQVPSPMRDNISIQFQSKAQAVFGERWLDSGNRSGNVSGRIGSAAHANTSGGWMSSNLLTLAFIAITIVVLAGTMTVLYVKKRRQKTENFDSIIVSEAINVIGT